MRRFAFACMAVCVLMSCTDERPDYPTGGQLAGPPYENGPPIIEAQPNVLGMVRDTLKLRASAYDPDGDDIWFRMTIGGAGYTGDYVNAHLNPTTGRFWFVPAPSDYPVREFEFTARDDQGNEASISFEVAISDLMWDQNNGWWGPSTWQNIIAFSPFGQEFIPDMTGLDVVQLWMSGSTGPAEFVMNIRTETITGPIVGTSEVLRLNKTAKVVATFEFDRIGLSPHGLYVMEVIQVSNDGWGARSGPRWAYPQGRQILLGKPRVHGSLWFREGMRWPLPADTTTGATAPRN